MTDKVTVRMTEQLVQDLDDMVREKGFKNRSDYIRYLIRVAIERRMVVIAERKV